MGHGPLPPAPDTPTMKHLAHPTALAVALLLAGCGGGGGGGGGDDSSPGTPDAGGDPGATPGTNVDVDDPNAPIAEQLMPATLARVAPGDGSEATRDAALESLPKKYTKDTTWTWQLQGDIDISYPADVYVLDLFAHLDGEVQSDLTALGRDTLCYFSVGTFEPWRPDVDFFTEEMMGNPHPLYPAERWLDVTDPEVVRIMVNRLDMAETVGCDGVELDNVDAYIPANMTGLDISEDEQAEFTRVLANEARKRGLYVALKNGPAILPEVVDWFDLSIVEECLEFDECDAYAPMVAADKPVFSAEYRLFSAAPGSADREVVYTYTVDQDANGDESFAASEPDFAAPAVSEGLERLCDRAEAAGIRTVLLPITLDGSWRRSCDD